MSSLKYKDLKRLYTRVAHLYLDFPILIDEKRVKQLDYNYLRIAQQQLQLNLLDYIKIEE